MHRYLCPIGSHLPKEYWISGYEGPYSDHPHTTLLVNWVCFLSNWGRVRDILAYQAQCEYTMRTTEVVSECVMTPLDYLEIR